MGTPPGACGARGPAGERRRPLKISILLIMEIAKPCSEICEENFLKCIEEENPESPLKQTKAFATCMDPEIGLAV